MQVRSTRTTATVLALMAVLSMAWQAQAQQEAAETTVVSKTYNNSPFSYHIRLLSDRSGCRVYRLTYPSPVVTPVVQNNTIPANYYLPKQMQTGVKYPAVISLHILNGDEQLTDLVCSVLASRGIPSISFKLPYYGERGLPKGPEALAGNPKLFFGAVAQAGEDIRRTVDLLASRPEINPERIGITGISLGGIVAAAAAGAEPRLYRASLMLAGGDLLQIIGHARESRPLKRNDREAASARAGRGGGEDRGGRSASFRPRPARARQQGRVLMINAGDDEVIPRPCTEKLAKALGIADRVVWLEGLGHYTAMAELPRAMRLTADFFAQDLPAAARANTELAPKRPALERPPPIALCRWSSRSSPCSAWNPATDRCHLIDVELSATAGGGKNDYRATCDLSAARVVAFRCTANCRNSAKWPWAKTAIPGWSPAARRWSSGTKNPVAGENAFSYVEPRHLMKLRMAAGIGGGIVLAPSCFNSGSPSKTTNPPADSHAIRITAKKQDKVPGETQLQFADDGRTPTTATFTAGNISGKLDFRGWQTNTIAPDELFEPPAGLEQVEVDQTDVCRMFAAMVNFAARSPGSRPGDRPAPNSRTRWRSSPAIRPDTVCSAAAKANRF